MRIGLLSDVHGNILALEAVLTALEREPVAEVLFAGDFVGYYPFVNEVIDRLRAVNVIAILGNHERYLLDPKLVSAEKRQACRLEDAAQTIRPDNLNWLGKLPVQRKLTLDDLDVILCHGSPWAFDEYIYPDSGQWERFSDLDADVVVMGHTHIPLEKQVDNLQLINPGSCGQPRDYQPGACYAVLETSNRKVMFYRETYDIHHLVRTLESKDFSRPLINILTRQGE